MQNTVDASRPELIVDMLLIAIQNRYWTLRHRSLVPMTENSRRRPYIFPSSSSITRAALMFSGAMASAFL